MTIFHPNINDIMPNIIGRKDDYCEGFISSPHCEHSNYLLAICFGTGRAKRRCFHTGSQMLDQIIAFDRAETDIMNLSQINMIEVSSFCGPDGLIWGYDIAQPPDLLSPHPLDPRVSPDADVQIYSIWPLVTAAKKLFGTVKKPVFPFFPGSHVPCAGKQQISYGAAHVYAAIALGIPENRTSNACLLMEDIGTFPIPMSETDQQSYKKMILEHMAQSVLVVGKNLNVNYKEIFVGMRDIIIEQGDIGCALVAAPYFHLAGNAVKRFKL